MIISKNNSGFTLIEVMLALAIAATLMTSIFILQSGAFTAVIRYFNNYQNMMHAKNFLLDTRRKREESKNTKQFRLEKKEEDPEAYLRYEFANADKTSLKNFKNIYFEKVDIAADAKQKEPNATLYTVLYMPEDAQ